MQVLYLGRAPRTKETLPNFREKCQVTRHSRVFRGLTGSQRTPWFWGVTLNIGYVDQCFGDILCVDTRQFFITMAIFHQYIEILPIFWHPYRSNPQNGLAFII